MANKQHLKASEARILILLSQIPENLKYTGAIAAKLDMDYCYTIRILKEMVEKGWLRTEQEALKVFHKLTMTSPTEAAKKLLMERR